MLSNAQMLSTALIAHIAIVMTIEKLVLNLRISNELKKRNSLARQSNHFRPMTFDFKSSETIVKGRFEA